MPVSRKNIPHSPDFLISWLGRTDVLAGQGHSDVGLGPSIGREDVLEAMLPMVEYQEKSILNRSLEQGLDLPGIMGEVAGHYIQRALEKTGGNRTKAAKLLGLKNYQTLNNWMEKYRVNSH